MKWEWLAWRGKGSPRRSPRGPVSSEGWPGYFFRFGLRPGLNVPLNFLAFAIWEEVQSRIFRFPALSSLGTAIHLRSIHAWSVWRETPMRFAASPVEHNLAIPEFLAYA
jgi:hypothetical protein